MQTEEIYIYIYTGQLKLSFSKKFTFVSIPSFSQKEINQNGRKTLFNI